MYQQRSNSCRQAQQQEQPPAFYTYIIFGLNDKRMKQAYHKKSGNTYQNTKKIKFHIIYHIIKGKINAYIAKHKKYL